MNNYLFLIIILFFSLADISYGYEVVVLKSSAGKINQRIQDIFTDEFNKDASGHGLKSIQRNDVHGIDLTRKNERESINTIQQKKPDLILALGANALKVALLVPDTPVLHLLVVNPEKIIERKRRVIGVSLSVPLEVQVNEMKSYFSNVKRIGLIYNPKQSLRIVKQLKSLRSGLEFIALPTENIAAVPSLIHSLHGKIDLLWMLPDLTTTNQMTIQSYVLFSIRNKVPLLTFSEKLYGHGATIAVTFDTDKMAKQAAALAMDMLLYPVEAEDAVLVPPPVKTIVNYKMAAKLGISIENRGEDE
jgi:putative ABC transport system substrate-binding protein